MGDRIRGARKDKDFSQGDFAEKVGVSMRQVGYWESGADKPSSDKIVRICEVLNVNAHWLLTGEHKMPYSDSPVPLHQVERTFKLVNELSLTAVPERDELKVYGAVPSARDIAFMEPVDRLWSEKQHKGDGDSFYGLIVRGRVMFPTIFEGDRVVVQKTYIELEPFDPQRGPANKMEWVKLHNQIVLVAVDSGEATLKRLLVYEQPHYDKGFVMMLQSDNRSFPSLPVWAETRIEIIGIVREILRDPRTQG